MRIGDRGERPVSQRRSRSLMLALGTIAVGLLVHFGGGVLAPWFRDVLGDALWAMMIVWWAGVAVPQLPLRTRAAAALAVCVAVETSQLYHAPWLGAVRGTVPGHLVLGSDFDPRDFVAYTAGILIAALVAREIA